MALTKITGNQIQGLDTAADATAITIDSSENVGIGTSSPENPLHVKGTNALLSPLRIQPVASTGVSIFSSRQDATQDRFTLGVAFSSGSLIIGNRVKPSDVSESDATGFLSSSTSNVARTAMKFDTNGDIIFYNALQQSTAVDSVVAMTQSMRINSAGNLQFNSGYGSVATAYGCRAWVNFDGTGTPSIRDSGNVSSVTDDAVGRFNVNLSNAMPDVNYAAVVTAGDSIFHVGMSRQSASSTTLVQVDVSDYIEQNYTDDASIKVVVIR